MNFLVIVRGIFVYYEFYNLCFLFFYRYYKLNLVKMFCLKYGFREEFKDVYLSNFIKGMS